MLVTLLIVAVSVYLFGWTSPDANGKTIVAVAGSVPASLPTFHIPEIKLSWIERSRIAEPGDRVSRPARSDGDCQVDRESDRTAV